MVGFCVGHVPVGLANSWLVRENDRVVVATPTFAERSIACGANALATEEEAANTSPNMVRFIYKYYNILSSKEKRGRRWSKNGKKAFSSAMMMGFCVE
jgi:hypothetical protein